MKPPQTKSHTHTMSHS